MRDLENEGRTDGRASTRVTLNLSAISGNHFSRSSLKKSCNSAANSIPVGPPPTTTMCSKRAISSGVWFAKVAVSIQSCNK